MAYLTPSIDADGIHVPSYDDIMEYLTGRYKAIFGDDVYIGEETKDYQLLSIFAKCLSDFGELVVEDYNSRNPNYATGNSLDLLLPLVSMTRKAATYSTVVLTLSGTEGTEIPEGSKVVDDEGNTWSTTEDATLDSEGSATANAVCDVAGAIAAPIGTITEIYDIIDGWDGVTNEANAIVGEDVETDAEVRNRRKNSLTTQNDGLYVAIYRAITAIDTVSFVTLYENSDNMTDSKGIPPHSICAVVKGSGTSEESLKIAEAIWKAKAPGVGTYGDTSQVYTDIMGNENTIYFSRPTTLNVTVNIALNKLSNYDSTRCVAKITEAIQNDINNLGVGKPWTVTTAFRDIYNAFAGEDIPFVLTAITGKTSSMGSASSIEVPCAYNQILSAGTINVVESD